LAIEGLVRDESDMELEGQEAGSIGEVVDAVERAAPHVVVTDALWPLQSGAGLVSQLRQRSPDARVLLVTITDDILLIRKILESGASGCIGRHATNREVASAIRQLCQGQIFIDPELAGSVVQEVLGCRITVHAGHKAHVAKQLSPRELEVLEYLLKGYTNQQVADSLFLSVKTTETYRARLKRKLGLRNRADIVRYGMEMGLMAGADIQPSNQAT
jgi:two-component system response regulator NreC